MSLVIRYRTRLAPSTWRLLLGLLLLGVLVLPAPRAAQAHAVPIASSPAANALLTAGPGTLEIAFNEPIVSAFSKVEILSQAGQPIETGPLTVVDDAGTRVGVTLPELKAGTYLVSWQVLSAVDGHTTSGSFPFGVGISEITGANAQVAETAPEPTLLSTGARWLNVTGVALLLGLFAFRLLLWRPALDVEDLEAEEQAVNLDFLRFSTRAGWAGVAMLALSAIVTLISQTVDYQVLSAGNLSLWLSTRFGQMWLARLVLTLAGAALLASFSRRGPGNPPGRMGDGIGLMLALGLVATVSMISHSAALAGTGGMAQAIDAIHVLAAGVWAGGLVQLALALRLARRLAPESRAWLSLALLLSFSAMAAVAIGSLLASGSYLAALHAGGWAALVGTRYGQVLLLKLSLALVPFAIAGANLLWLKPRLQKGYATPDAPATQTVLRRLRALVAVEAVFALLILVAAGLLTDLQRGQDATLLTGDGESLSLAQPAEDLRVTLNVSPALVGQNQFDLLLLDENGAPVRDAKEVTLRFTFLGRAIGTAEGELDDLGDGHFRLESSNISLSGPWQVEAAIRRPGSYDVFTAFRLDAGLDGQVTPFGAQSGPISQIVTFLTRTNSLVPAIALVLFALGWGFVANRAAQHDWQLVPLLAISLLALWIGGSGLLQFSRDYTPAMFSTNPIPPDTASIATGQALFEGSCASCHGSTGHGDGPAASGLASPPANFTGGHTATHTDGDLFYWIKEGVEGTPMPAWESAFDDEQIWHLVNYVRRLSIQAPAS